MQGKKHYQPKLFTTFKLHDRVPLNNFYRSLKDNLDLNFLYKETRLYYGFCGQKSLDPVVFFKLCLVGYLENIISDRKLIDHCSMRMDILYFLDYDIDEELPWHSTISRTRQLFPEEVFEAVFTKVFSMCVEKGMVSGHTQAIDSAPVKANASMDSLELKVPEEELEAHLQKVRYMSSPDRISKRKAKENKAPKEQQQINASEGELKALQSRNKKWSEDQDQRVGAGNKDSKYTSNKTHYSPTDPDARISVKPGKARKLNYLGQMAVDTGHHVISHIQADLADKKDNQCLPDILPRLKSRLNRQGLFWQNILADTAYSSGENYALLEQQNLTSFIPPHGTYKGGPDGFTYHQEGNYYLCKNNKKLLFKGTKRNVKGILDDHYATRRRDCIACPFKEECKGKSHEKRIRVTHFRAEYERAISRVKSKRGRYMKAKRQSTVEPVFGTLTQFLGMRKVNTRGLRQANKILLMAAVAYNIKKYLKFTNKIALTNVNEAKLAALYFISRFLAIIRRLAGSKILTSTNN
ncbi:MAG: IS1182 family transposase [Candidatus Halalkalibacterium sp. M3_1C_030]